MPIYEFYCDHCNTIFNFFSKTINTTKIPNCPQCKTRSLNRQMSAFAIAGRAREEDMDDLPFDEGKMERAMQVLANEAENINEDDPRQAADLMRKLSHMSGLEMGDGMEEALRRMEQGEDPEQIEADMSDILESEDPFVMMTRKRGAKSRRPAPRKDENLYDL